MNVAVIGAGAMGSGIAQAAAAGGHTVVLVDTTDEALARAKAGIASSTQRLVKRGSLTEEQAAATEAITMQTDYRGFDDVELVIEAVFESVQAKEAVWRAVSEAAPATAIFASNTSSLSITELSQFVTHKERFCGMHFFNPVAMMPLVEVVRGLDSAEETVMFARDFAAGIGKTPIVCEDKPGFIVNRLLIPYINDAVHALAEGVASAEDIDTAMKLGANMPLGPLALADLVGIDVGLAATESLFHEFGDPKFRPSPLMRQMVRAGRLGRKTGRGFYDYTKE